MSKKIAVFVKKIAIIVKNFFAPVKKNDVIERDFHHCKKIDISESPEELYKIMRHMHVISIF